MSATVNRRDAILGPQMSPVETGAHREVQPRLAHGTRKMEKLQREDADASSGIADIVHDLKNPLATIALEMTLLDDTLQSTGQEELRATVRRITHNLDFVDRMVQDLLDSCAIAEGALVIQREKTDLRALVERVIDRAVPSRDRARIVFEARAPLTVTIDVLRIERVVANLISNALKFAPRATPVVVRIDAMPGFARVSVTDAGPGMTAEEMLCVFDKYRRTSSASSYEGNGLGLHVSKQIVEAHGGTIDVESVLGLGSHFFFELPMA